MSLTCAPGRLKCLSRMLGVTGMTTATSLNFAGKVSAVKTLVDKYNVGDWVCQYLQGLNAWYGYHDAEVRDSLSGTDQLFMYQWEGSSLGKWATAALRYDLSRSWRSVKGAVLGDSGSVNYAKKKPSMVSKVGQLLRPIGLYSLIGAGDAVQHYKDKVEAHYQAEDTTSRQIVGYHHAAK